jgi:hypothetical protein
VGVKAFLEGGTKEKKNVRWKSFCRCREKFYGNQKMPPKREVKNKIHVEVCLFPIVFFLINLTYL